MRKTTLSLLMLLLFMAFQSMAQWTTTNIGVANTSQKMLAIDNSTAIVVTSNSGIFKTTDGAATWQDKSPSGIPSKILYTANFIGQHVLVGVMDTFLLKSDNLGDTWSVISLTQLSTAFTGFAYNPLLGSSQKTAAVTIVDDTTWLTTIAYKDAANTYRAYVLKSADAGATWDILSADLAGGVSITYNAIQFVNDSTGYLYGTKATLLKTTNKGADWTALSIISTDINSSTTINDMCIISADSILLATSKGLVITKDAFASVTQMTTTAINEIEYYLDSVMFIGGSSTTTTRSLDFGTTWDVANNQLDGSIFDLTLFNSRIYGLSSNGNLYSINENELFDLDVDFEVSAQVGNNITINNLSKNYGSLVWSLGDGTVLDYDITSYSYLEKGNYKIAVKATNAIGEATSDTVSVTVDSIATAWVSRTYTDGTLSKLAVLNDSTAVLAAGNTAIGYTIDEGKNFIASSIPDSLAGHTNYDLSFLDENTGISTFMAASDASYTNGFVIKTSDAGKTWSPIALDAFSSHTGIAKTDIAAGVKPYFYASCALNTEMAYVSARWQVSSTTSAGYTGAIFKTTDKGETWSVAYDSLYNSYAGVINAIKFSKDEQTGYIAGVKLLHKTTDGGATWTNIPANDFGSINDMLMLNSDTIFLATQYGVVKTTDGFSTWTIVNSDLTFDIIAINDSTLISGRNSTSLKFSSDYGKTWSLLSNGITNTCFELEFFANKVYALSSKGQYFVTPISTFYQPEADFDYAVSGKTVTFTNHSTNAQSYVWTFGNGETSSEKSPVYTYPSCGKWLVSLTATMEGNSVTVSDSILVDDEAPVFDLCPNDTSIMLAEGETELSVTWTEAIASDNVSSTVIDITKTQEPGAVFGIGTTTVTYTATDEAGNTSTCSFTVEIKEYVSVNELTNTSVKLFPNPSDNGNFSIDLGNSSTQSTISIYSLSGTVIYTETTVKQGTIAINQNLKQGVYLVAVNNENGTFHSKLVIK